MKFLALAISEIFWLVNDKKVTWPDNVHLGQFVILRQSFTRPTCAQNFKSMTSALPKILPFSVFFSSSCILLQSALSSLPSPWTTTFMQTILYSSFHPPNFDSSITQPAECSSTDLFSDDCQVSTLLRLNSCSLNSKNNSTKIHNCSINTTHSALNLTFISDEHLRWPNFFSLQTLPLPHSSTLLHPPLPWFQNSLHHCSLKTWLL